LQVPELIRTLISTESSMFLLLLKCLHCSSLLTNQTRQKHTIRIIKLNFSKNENEMEWQCMRRRFNNNGDYPNYVGIFLRLISLLDLFFFLKKFTFVSLVYPQYNLIIVYREMLSSATKHFSKTLSSKYFENACNQYIGNRNIWLLWRIITYFRMCSGRTR
jgi:hypothetical protein